MAQTTSSNAASIGSSERTAILVVGAPRSGTSAVSHVLSELGVDFGQPSRFVDPESNAHNPIFFELKSLNELNNEVIGWFGHVYPDFDFLPLRDDFDQGKREGFLPLCEALLGEEFHGSRVIGLKDPRFCFTLPLWSAALQNLGYRVRFVWVLRRLDEIVASNERVNSGWPRERNIRVASLSTLAAAHFLEGADCVALDYDQALIDPDAAVQRLSKWLGCGNNEPERLAAAARVLQVNLRRFDRGALTLPPEAQAISSAVLSGALSPTRYRDLAAFLRGIGVQRICDATQGGGTQAYTQALKDAQHQRECFLSALQELAATAAMEQFGRQDMGDAEPVRPDTAALYYRERMGQYDQSRVEVLPHDGLRQQTRFEFKLPPGARPECVRFDPSVLPGMFEFSALRINGVPVDDFGHRVLTARQQRLPTAGLGEVRVLAFDDDVQLELDLHGCMPPDGTPMRIELLCRRLEVAQALRQLVDSAVQISVPAAVEAAHAQSVSNLRSENDDLRTRLDRLGAAIADISHWQRLTFLQRLRRTLRRPR